MASQHLPSSCHAYTSPGVAEDLSEDSAVYKDIRALKRSQSRHAKQSAKYHGFRGVDPNWVGQPYDPIWRFEQMNWWKPAKAISNDYPSYQRDTNRATCELNPKSHTYTKRDMWLDRDINIWPLDRQQHVGKKIREKRAWKYQEKTLQRRTKQRARAIAFEADDSYWNEDVDSVYDIDEESGNDLYELQDGYQSDAVFHEDDKIPASPVVDAFSVLHDQSCKEDDDYSMICDWEFDVVSIASNDSDWGIG
ncbi:uncharacterized protein A1O9_02273 [Exophiala aquamarina CBS 119918]|uniref:Uncharacterized protein n=1 Tax=Exophiala aquamarina CBS 119918 TaxID=1182545 RepID=A0A072PLU1_9EURO|nr:uncharacterized protein A1O9_02273 [Exophiala aquamarina CBS 119918]KEF60712.1 hypothetical protein A1O9_02273 [Exophiala aquamarina CBS 119918]